MKNHLKIKIIFSGHNQMTLAKSTISSDNINDLKLELKKK